MPQRRSTGPAAAFPKDVYPELFRIGDFVVTSFGAMLAVAALVGLLVFRREARRSGLPDGVFDGALLGLLCGLAGAKLLYVAEHAGEEPLWDLVTARGGMSWFGGLAGGVAGALAFYWRRRWPIAPILSAATPALALGHAVGRLGCFLVGDDYGRPSTLPWAVAFPDGLPPTTDRVHPTQLYEAVLLVLVAWLLVRWRRAGRPDQLVLGRYLLLTGTIRFFIEFLRVNERVLFQLTVAHLASAAVALVGLAMVWRAHSGAQPRRFPARPS